MGNVVNLFETKKPAPPKDVSTETYFFTFAGTIFHFGGGAFTRDLLERLQANRETVNALIENDRNLKLAAITNAVANADIDADTKTLLTEIVNAEAHAVAELVSRLHTPNDVDDAMSDDTTCRFMPLVLAAVIHAAYVPFDLLRMSRANWCLIEDDPADFLKKLESFFTATPDHSQLQFHEPV